MNQRGQSLVLSILFLTVLIGMSAMVIDVGSWYRADRKLQANADAAALAGAHELPANTAAAEATALAYADKNDGGLEAKNVKFRTTFAPHDTIEVLADRPAPGFFAQLFGRDTVDVRAKAVARTGVLGSAVGAAPIAIDYRHEMLQCGVDCWDEDHETTLDFAKVGPGAFRLLNIDGSYGGTGLQDIGDWIGNGLNKEADIDRWYYSDPGIKPNSSHVKDALDFRDETELLLPVYNETRAQGAGFEYYVIGWAVFHVTGYEIRGVTEAHITGYFVDMVWAGIPSPSKDSPSFGARAVTLIE